MKQDHLMMNVAPDQTTILSLQIFLDYRSQSSIDKKILMTLPSPSPPHPPFSISFCPFVIFLSVFLSVLVHSELYVGWDWDGMVIIGHGTSKSTFGANFYRTLSWSKPNIVGSHKNMCKASFPDISDCSSNCTEIKDQGDEGEEGLARPRSYNIASLTRHHNNP